MNTFIQRLAFGLLALFLLVYVGFQVYRYTSAQYETETAYTYTVAESARVTGVALRNEVILEERVNSGFVAYIPSDGTKVSAGSPIAEVYRSSEDAANVRKLRELERRGALLEKAQDPGTTSYAHTDVLNKQIFSELGGIIDAVNADDLSGLQPMSDKLLVLMNTKQIATGKQDNFSAELERITAEEEYYKNKLSGDPSVIKSPRPGYFMRGIDGLEGRADMKHLDKLTPKDVFNLMNTPAPKTPSKQVGKLMTDHIWYFAAQTPVEELDKYRLGASVTLDFNIGGIAPVPATISEINKRKDENDAVVIFQCDYVNEALINLRAAQADVKFKSITGLRVSSSAIRFVGIEKGVYTVMGEKLVFCPVEVIYESPGFVLCRALDAELPENKTCLQQFDEVVTKGVRQYEDQWTR